jgi:hypothetical protein
MDSTAVAVLSNPLVQVIGRDQVPVPLEMVMGLVKVLVSWWESGVMV